MGPLTDMKHLPIIEFVEGMDGSRGVEEGAVESVITSLAFNMTWRTSLLPDLVTIAGGSL